MADVPPALSVIVPVLDETATLPTLFATLAEQQGVAFELILCDGGSGDGTVSLGNELAGRSPFPCHVVAARRGRGRQMNAGAAAATGEYLLFLHADSRFADPLALRDSLAVLQTRLLARGDERVAGHFSLRFQRSDPHPSLPYYYYECKARLDRPGCIHGDQGFLLKRSFFADIGPCEETLPFFEDDALAAKVRCVGEWVLLSAEIFTSARRFESEGLWQRQTLNALLMNFAAIGWNDFFSVAGNLYCQQNQTSRLDLYPYFRAIDKCLGQLPWQRRLHLWCRTGAFVCGNAWQGAFFLDVRRNFAAALPAGQGELPSLRLFDSRLGRIVDSPPGRFLAIVLVWGWFHGFRLALRFNRNRKE